MSDIGKVKGSQRRDVPSRWNFCWLPVATRHQSLYSGGMKTNENQIEWTGKKEWGYDGLTHRAEVGSWRFHAGRVGKEWVLRGWGPNGSGAYRPVKTLAAAKQEAADIIAAASKKEGA